MGRNSILDHIALYNIWIVWVIWTHAKRLMSPNVGLMLGERLWRWHNIKPALGECLVTIPMPWIWDRGGGGELWLGGGDIIVFAALPCFSCFINVFYNRPEHAQFPWANPWSCGPSTTPPLPGGTAAPPPPALANGSCWQHIMRTGIT